MENYRDYFRLERTLLTHNSTHPMLKTEPPLLSVRGFFTTFGELIGPVELVGGAHQVGDLVLLQQLDVVVHGPVLEIQSLLKFSISGIQDGEAVEQNCKKDFVTSRLMVKRKALFGLMMIFCTS